MARISEETIQRVLAASDVVDVIASYFPVKRAGTNYVALCPFHREKSPSFNISPQRQQYHCFGCGASGSVFRFVMEYENVEFPEAVRRLAQKSGIPIVEEAGDGRDAREGQLRKRLLALHQLAAGWFHQQLMDRKTGSVARGYLRGRDFNGEIAERWKIGFAPDRWDGFSSVAAQEGFTAEELFVAGLAVWRQEERPQEGHYDRFRGRVMFSICNDVGEVVGFSGRVLEEGAKTAKYVNSPETPLFRKGRLLFGLHLTKRAIIEADCAILCEGQVDLIRMYESGIKNVVAPQGTAFTPDQARAVKRLANRAVLLFDADGAGKKAAEAAFRLLAAQNAAVHAATLPQGEDPDSFLRAHGSAELAEMIGAAPDFFERELEDSATRFPLRTAQGKMKAAEHLAGLLAAVEEPILLDSFLQKAASRLAVPADEIRRLRARAAKTAAVRGGGDEEVAPAPRRIELVASSRMLCRFLLSVPSARRWILARPWRETCELVPDGALLMQLVEADFESGDPPSVTGFLASMKSEEESVLSGTLEMPLPEQPQQEEVFTSCWLDLRRRALTARRQALEARLRADSLEPGPLLETQKEILDLQMELMEIAQLLTQRS